jgi:hypothetical protein
VTEVVSIAGSPAPLPTYRGRESIQLSLADVPEDVWQLLASARSRLLAGGLLPCSPLTSERNAGCGTAGGWGADEPVTIGAVDDSTAVKECAARLVDELQVDPGIALRFARVRKGDFKKAKLLLQADLAWRAQKIPVTQVEFPTVLASGTWRVLGVTSKGVPVAFSHVGLWNPATYGVDEHERFIIYLVEHMLRMGRGEQFMFIFDLQGWSWSHLAAMQKIARQQSVVQDKP